MSHVTAATQVLRAEGFAIKTAAVAWESAKYAAQEIRMRPDDLGILGGPVPERFNKAFDALAVKFGLGGTAFRETGQGVLDSADHYEREDEDQGHNIATTTDQVNRNWNF